MSNRTSASVITFLLLTAALSVSACSGGGVRKALGLQKRAPDEFMVMTRPALSVPPDFELRPPASADEQMGSTIPDEARNTLFDSGNSAAPEDISRSSQGEHALLQKAKVKEAAPNIRDLLNEENSRRAKVKSQENDPGFFDKIVEKVRPSGSEPVVDANAEEKRLKENKAAGKPVTEGETPTLEDKKTTLQKIFD